MSGTPVPDDQTMPDQQPVETAITPLGTDAQHGLSEAAKGTTRSMANRKPAEISYATL